MVSLNHVNISTNIPPVAHLTPVNDTPTVSEQHGGPSRQACGQTDAQQGPDGLQNV